MLIYDNHTPKLKAIMCSFNKFLYANLCYVHSNLLIDSNLDLTVLYYFVSFEGKLFATIFLKQLNYLLKEVQQIIPRQTLIAPLKAIL